MGKTKSPSRGCEFQVKQQLFGSVHEVGQEFYLARLCLSSDPGGDTYDNGESTGAEGVRLGVIRVTHGV